MSENATGNGRTKSPIDHWETLEVLYSARSEAGREPLGIVIEVQQPVFEGGRTGRPSMGCVVRRGERMLRVPCRDGKTEEIVALREMLGALPDSKLAECSARYAEIVGANAPPPREDRQGRAPRSPRPGEAGSGLSRFTTVSKRERRRQKQGDGERSRRHED